MPGLSSTVRDLLTEKFHALLDECDLVSENAAFGKTLDDLENFFLIQGRTFLREVFQEKLQERVEQTETNVSSPCSGCKKKRPSRIRKRETSSPPTEPFVFAVATTTVLPASNILFLSKEP
jgi:hypothetical protein